MIHFPGAGLAADLRRDVYCNAAMFRIQQFAFAGVDASTDLDARASASAHRASAQRMGFLIDTT